MKPFRISEAKKGIEQEKAAFPLFGRRHEGKYRILIYKQKKLK